MANHAAVMKSKRTELTDRQSEIFRFVFETTRTTGVQPALRDICDHFRFSSPQAARGHLLCLVRKGWIAPLSKEARSVRFLKVPATGAPFRGFVLPPED